MTQIETEKHSEWDGGGGSCFPSPIPENERKRKKTNKVKKRGNKKLRAHEAANKEPGSRLNKCFKINYHFQLYLVPCVSSSLFPARL